MSETTAQYLSRLHSAAALEAKADTVERRAGAIDLIVQKATLAQVVAAASVAAGVATDLDKLQWLLSPVSEADPSFAPVTVDKSAAAVASALTHRILGGVDARSVAASLIVLSARMSKASDEHLDGWLTTTAQQRLWALQQLPLPDVKYAVPAQSVTTEQITAVHTPLSQNTVAPAAEPLKAVVELLAKADAAQGKAVADAVRALLMRQILLEEEIQMQWWVFGRASHDLLRPFADLPPFEAAARAAKELAGMVSQQRPAGPFAAPALLERVLESSQKARAGAQPFHKAMTAVPRESRRAIFVHKPSASLSPGVFPVMLAAEFSIESEDAPDWQPRFARTARLEPTVEVTPVEFAKQLLREMLLWKLLPAQ
jgi:hypothetical protein